MSSQFAKQGLSDEEKKQWRYSCWRMNVYMAHGKITLDEINHLVSLGHLYETQSVRDAVTWIHQNFRPIPLEPVSYADQPG